VGAAPGTLAAVRTRPWGWIAVGGAAGAGIRWAVATTLGGGDRFPAATFAVNVVGCLALGALLALGGRRRVGPAAADALGVGFCGGLTTFSTLAVEVVDLVERGRTPLALAYVAASLVVGLVAFVVGGGLALRVPEPGPEPGAGRP
jgi:fluoride exporter